jgi:hypothetical protein
MTFPKWVLVPFYIIGLTVAGIKEAGACVTGSELVTPQFHVSIDGGLARPIKSGQTVEIRWKIDSISRVPCGELYFLVLSFPNYSRFEGAHLLALPSGARGPVDPGGSLTCATTRDGMDQ